MNRAIPIILATIFGATPAFAQQAPNPGMDAGIKVIVQQRNDAVMKFMTKEVGCAADAATAAASFKQADDMRSWLTWWSDQQDKKADQQDAELAKANARIKDLENQLSELKPLAPLAPDDGSPP